MPEVHGSEKRPGDNGNRRFINEKVVKPPLTRRQIVWRIFVFCFAAFIFGVISSIGFSLTKTYAERYLVKETQEESAVSIPKDEIPTSAAVEEIPEESAEQESEPIEDKVQSAMENYRYTVDDLNTMLSSLRTQIQKASKGIVIVHSVQQKVDWFDNPVETTGQYAGAVIAGTDQEFLILTSEAAVESADSIKVTFDDGSDVSGRMKQKDSVSGIAIVSVNVSDLSDSVLKSVQVLPLGNSYTAREGDLIAAVGGPAGMVKSVDYGFVSYVMKNAPQTDQWVRMLYADILSDADTGTFFLNTTGELIGWTFTKAEDEAGMAVTEITGVSDYKGILEKLSNGLGAPAFGIIGQEVSDAVAGQGIPHGIYVASVCADSAAYNAGIQNGDIIVKINSEEIETAKDFQSEMESLECGQLINVTVQRNGREQFAELEYQVTVGAR